MKPSKFDLTAITPIDGRYRAQVEELSNYSSEFALIKYRIKIELEYLIALSKIKVIRKITEKEKLILKNLFLKFNYEETESLKTIEEETRHDVKAVEIYIKQKIKNTSLSDISEFIHFGLTSEDINNIAYRLMMADLNEKVVLPSVKELNKTIFDFANEYKNQLMLGRTHGQAAVPTTLGKEFLVFYERLENEIKILKKIYFKAKLNGAVGNYNSFYFAYPEIDWKKFSKNFIESYGLKNSKVTTQIAPYEDIIYFFQTVQRINGIILDLNQDVWRYISDNWLVQENKKKEVGSSTMPQKINPILFENSEGNLIIANSLIEGFTNKLPISRLQRDLSGSTISRNFGVVISYCLLSYKNCISGIKLIKPNSKKMLEDLNSDWSILSEAVQIYLKKNKINNGYDIVKDHVRGRKMTKDMFWEMIDDLPINTTQKLELKKISPENYIGISF